MSSLTATTATSAGTESGQDKTPSVTLSAENLLSPQGFTFFQNRLGHFEGQPEPIKKIRYPKYGEAMNP